MTEELELGPIDYLVVEYPNGKPTGEALPYLLDLVDRNVITVLDLALVVKDGGGQWSSLTLTDLPALGAPEFEVFAGAASGMLDDDDLQQVADVLDDGSVGAIIVYENTWAGPFASALRRAGAQMVASGRIPVQAVLAALEAEDAADATEASDQ